MAIYLEDFAGFVGDGVNDDTQAVLSAVAAQKASGGTIECRSRKAIKLTASVLVDFDDFCWNTKGSVILPFSNGQVKVFSFKGPDDFPSTALVSATSGGDVAVNVVDPTNFAVGRYVRFAVSRSNGMNFFISKVRRVNGNTIYICDAIPRGLGIAPSEQHWVVPFTGIKRAKMSARIDGSNLSGWPTVLTPTASYTSHAISANELVDSDLDIEVSNFGDAANNGSASAVHMDHGHANRLKYRGFKCGSYGEGELELGSQTGLIFDISSHSSLCFGPCLRFVAYGRGSVDSNGSYARGVKLYAVRHSTIQSLIGCGSGATGVCISNQTSYNTIDSIIANGNSTDDGRNAGNRIGVWFSDEENINNNIGIIQAYSNADSPLEVNPSDQYNKFGMVETDDPARIFNSGGALFSLSGKEPIWNT